jgi:hypothetical protein
MSGMTGCLFRRRGAEMDATALRELQAPLKAAYRERPEAALVTLTAAGDLAEGVIACKV